MRDPENTLEVKLVQKENGVAHDYGTNCVDCERYKRLGDVCVIEHEKKFLWEFCRDFVPKVVLPDYHELMQTVKQDQALARQKAKEKKEREKKKREKEREAKREEKRKKRRARLRRIRERKKLLELKQREKSAKKHTKEPSSKLATQAPKAEKIIKTKTRTESSPETSHSC